MGALPRLTCVRALWPPPVLSCLQSLPRILRTLIVSPSRTPLSEREPEPAPRLYRHEYTPRSGSIPRSFTSPWTTRRVFARFSRRRNNGSVILQVSLVLPDGRASDLKSDVYYIDYFGYDCHTSPLNDGYSQRFYLIAERYSILTNCGNEP